MERMRSPPSSTPPPPLLPQRGPAFATWSLGHVASAAWQHPVPCASAITLLLFMAVEYTIPMVPPRSPPVDVGFSVTASLHRALAANLAVNNLLAALNTVGVRRNASALYCLDFPGGGQAAADHRRPLHVHRQGNPRLLHPAPSPTRVPRFRCGLSGGQCLLLPLLLRPRRWRGDRISGHAAGATAGVGVGVRRTQPPAERAAACLARPLHHRLGGGRRRRLRVRRVGRQVRRALLQVEALGGHR